MATSREILRKYSVTPRKRLGQSFLVERNVAARIVAASNVGHEDVVVEIGPGHGALTAFIVEKAKRVIAVEIDAQMADILHRELEAARNLEIVRQDVLDYDFSMPLSDSEVRRKIKIIGNLPYSISSPILFRLIAFRNTISSMTLMFQKEVAERIMAPPDTKEYGILSVMTAMYALPSRVMHVPASCFYPRPKVDSSVLKMEMRQTPLCAVRDNDLFLRVVKCAFAKRRKTLFNNLRSSDLFPGGGEAVMQVLERTGIDGRRRGETLTVEEFALLSNAVLDLQLS